MSVEAKGLDEAIAATEAIAQRLLDLSPVMEVIAEDLKAFIDDSFENSTSPDGSPWAPLSPATIKRRRKGRGSGSPKTLVDTGTLRNSISVAGSKSGVRFGTTVPYAGFHQFGTGRIPVRSFMPVVKAGEGFTTMVAGPAAEEWARYRDSITHYIKTGEIL